MPAEISGTLCVRLNRCLTRSSGMHFSGKPRRKSQEFVGLPAQKSSSQQFSQQPAINKYMSTSRSRSTPEIGADTIRIPLESFPPSNTYKKHRRVATAWMVVGILLLVADGIAMFAFSENVLEATVIACLSMPTGILVILAALNARK